MTAGDIVPVAGEMSGRTLASASPDVLREMIREFAKPMMEAVRAIAIVRTSAGLG